MRISRRTYVNLKQFLSRSNEHRKNEELAHSWNFFFRNSLHINITGGRPRMAQITEVENKERRDVSGSRLTRYELETRVDLLNDPSPYHLPYFSFFPTSFFFLSLFYSISASALNTRTATWPINRVRNKQAAQIVINCDNTRASLCD